MMKSWSWLRSSLLVVLVIFIFCPIALPASSSWPLEERDDISSLASLDELLKRFDRIIAEAAEGQLISEDILDELRELALRLKEQREMIASVCFSLGLLEDTSKTDIETMPREFMGPTVTYKGIVEDRVGIGNQSTPDGHKDGWFQVEVYFPEPVEVTRFTLHSSNEEGSKGSSYWYSNSSHQAWILGVFQDDVMLNPNREEPLGEFAGLVQFDLYVSSDGSLVNDSYFLLEMLAGDRVFSSLFLLDETIEQ